MSTYTVPTRAYDAVYDPVYTTSASGGYAAAPTASQMPQANNRIISGGNRYKYFRRPLVPFLHSVPPEVLLAPTVDTSANVVQEEEIALGATRDQAVQTKYRESEAQTDPFTPDYTVKPGQEPEILTLASLSYQKGLPAGLAEVEMIERARQKREFEASLPPITDEASFALRKQMMEEQELREWSHRENEIDKLQEERLSLLHTAIHERDQENEFLNEQRVEALRQRRLEEKDQAITLVQQRRIKALRKLSKQRKNVTPSGEKKTRDIIGEYASYGSKVYAPLTRHGQAVTVDKRAERYEVRKTDLTTSLNGLATLEDALPSKLTRTNTSKPRKKAPRSAVERKEAVVQAHLQRMDDLIKTQKLTKSAEGALGGTGTMDGGASASASASLPTWRRRAEKTERPKTPSVSDEPEEAELSQLALMLLQRLIRGRAAQNAMFEGKERRAELIAELRGATEMAAPEAEEEELQDKSERGVAVLEGTMETLQGEVVSATLDFLAKELERKEAQVGRGQGRGGQCISLRYSAVEVRALRETDCAFGPCVAGCLWRLVTCRCSLLSPNWCRC